MSEMERTVLTKKSDTIPKELIELKLETRMLYSPPTPLPTKYFPNLTWLKKPINCSSVCQDFLFL